MKKFAFAAALFAFPLLAAAQVDSLQDLATFVIDFINNIAVPLVFAVAFIVFIWGVFLYFIAGGHDEEGKEKGKSLMVYGLVGFFIMVSVWGLVNILTGTLNLENQIPELPEAPEAN